MNKHKQPDSRITRPVNGSQKIACWFIICDLWTLLLLLAYSAEMMYLHILYGRLIVCCNRLRILFIRQTVFWPQSKHENIRSTANSPIRLFDPQKCKCVYYLFAWIILNSSRHIVYLSITHRFTIDVKIIKHHQVIRELVSEAVFLYVCVCVWVSAERMRWEKNVLKTWIRHDCKSSNTMPFERIYRSFNWLRA